MSMNNPELLAPDECEHEIALDPIRLFDRELGAEGQPDAICFECKHCDMDGYLTLDLTITSNDLEWL